MTSIRALALTAALLAGASAGCRGSEAAIEVAPPAVAPELAPSRIQTGDVGVFENTDKSTKKAFADTPNAMVADGKLWELRKGERLVGTLQISTVKAKVDLTEARQRNAILRSIISSRVEELDVGEQTVWVSASEEKVVYVWFGSNLYEVLVLKEKDLDYEAVLREVLAHQQASEAWSPLPITEEDLEETSS